MNKALTISIVSHGQGPLVQALLDDLAAAPARTLARVIVTLNIPEDWQPRFPADRLCVVRNPQPRGFGANHNAAFQYCQTDAWGVFNPDLRLPDTNALDALLHRLFEDDLALVSPRVLDEHRHPAELERRLLSPWEILTRRRRCPPQGRAVAWLPGMCFVLQRTDFAAIEGFDERFFLYGEDFDLCARLRLRGRRFAVIEAAHVIHAAQHASHRSLRHLRWHVESLVRLWTSPVFWRYRHWLAHP